MLPFVASPLFGAMDIFPLPHIYVADNFEFLGYRQVPVASNFTCFHSSILAADNLHNLLRNQTQITPLSLCHCLSCPVSSPLFHASYVCARLSTSLPKHDHTCPPPVTRWEMSLLLQLLLPSPFPSLVSLATPCSLDPRIKPFSDPSLDPFSQSLLR